jgi:hypothetical protein
LDIVSESIASQIRGKSPEQMRQHFMKIPATIASGTAGAVDNSNGNASVNEGVWDSSKQHMVMHEQVAQL